MRKIQTFFEPKGKIKEPKNPPICLYHSTTEEKLPKILMEGLDPYSIRRCEESMREIAEEEGISEERMWEMMDMCEAPSIRAREELDELLGREEGIYFVKDENDIVSHEAIVEVPAEFIPCRCIEDNYDIENDLYTLLYDSYSSRSPMPSQEEIWDVTEEVEKSIRYLDKKENSYTTEVICPCEIPPEIIVPYGSEKFGSCKIREGK